MLDHERVQSSLFVIKIPLPQPTIFREIGQHRKRDDPHRGHSRLVFIDRIFKLALPERIIEIRTLT